MTGESELKSLLRNMQPVVVEGEYVFSSVQESQLEDLESPLMIFRENEGSTVIVTRAIAERNR
ncbi:unnamed protein product, partial [marine sediment metagenome]